MSTDETKYRSFNQCLFISLTLNLGYVILAYTMYLLNGPLIGLRVWLQIETDSLEGILVISYGFGALLGFLMAITVINSISRRHLLLISDILSAVGLIGILFQNYYLFCFSRFFGGIGASLNTIGVTIFLKEIIPVEIYGILSAQGMVMMAVGTIVQSFMVLGFPVFEMQDSTADMAYWPIYLAIPFIICILRQMLMCLYFKHESPYYSIKNDQISNAKEYFELIYKDEFQEEQFQIIILAIQQSSHPKIKQYSNRRKTLGILVNTFYGLSGIITIVGYSTFIFSKVTTEEVARVLTIGMTFLKFIFYSTGGLITQKYGRRNPLLIGTLLISLIMISMGFSAQIYDSAEDDSSLKQGSGIYSIVAIYCYFIVFFNTFGAILPIYAPEIVQGTPLVIGNLLSSLATVAVTFLFPIVREYGMQYVFYGLACILSGSLVYFYFYVIETNNLNDLEIADKFTNKKSNVQESIYTSLVTGVQS